MSGKETRTSAGRRRGPMGHGGHGMPGEKAKDFRGTMKKLAVYLGAYKVPLLFVVIFAIGSTIFNIVGPKILGNSTGISSFWVLFSILLFGGLFGFAGMVLGVPVFAMIYSVISRMVSYGLRSRGLPQETEDYMGRTGPLSK